MAKQWFIIHTYSGYERKDAYPEYSSIIKTMREVGQLHGCGRAHWEYASSLDRFGTPGDTKFGDGTGPLAGLS